MNKSQIRPLMHMNRIPQHKNIKYTFSDTHRTFTKVNHTELDHNASFQMFEGLLS